MEGNDIQVLLAVAVYMLVVLAIGIWFAKRANKSSEDFFLGGRKLGPWVAAMSAEASDMSGWLLMGLPGVAYFMGASEAAWTAIGLAVGTYLNWKFVAVRLRKYTAKTDSITLPEFFSDRFHDKKNILMTIAAIIILLFFSIYMGSCFATCGKLLYALFGFDYFSMMVIGAVLVFAYTLMGGFLAESATDFIQGVLMFVSLLVVVIGGVVYVGGIDNVIANLQNYDGFLDIFAVTTPVLDGSGSQVITSGLPSFGTAESYGLITIISTLAWGLGYFGMPQVLLRFMGIRSHKELGKSRRIAIVWCVISLACAVFIGFIGRAMLPDAFLTSSSAENIFILMTTTLLPPFAAGIIVSGILAAAMSSSDSYMLIAASAVSRNLFKGVIKKDATEKQVMWVSRFTMIALLIFGIAIAADPSSTIFGIVSYAWAGFGAAFGPLILLALYWRRTNLTGAIAGMLTGGIVVIVWHNWIAGFGGIWAIYELLPAFILSIIVIVVVSLLTEAPSKEVTDEFDTYLAYEDEEPAIKSA